MITIATQAITGAMSDLTTIGMLLSLNQFISRKSRLVYDDGLLAAAIIFMYSITYRYW